MSDGISTISQSFKVKWLNTTLKFVKNDNLMIMKSPEMPLSHVEYLHNLIWQRKHDVGLGVKSLYAPLWEAMRIFSLKYRFKVSVMKSIDNTGQLVIEKLKKTDQGADRVDNNNEESVTDMEKVSRSRSGKEINKKKQTKSQKYYNDKSKIIESISPIFLRITLQKISDFINDKKEASLIFTDLAHIEAKFLENFLGIYNRRNMFESMMSPACNNIFNEMQKCFSQFDKTCKLEVDAKKTNVKTKKREVTFLKVPKYIRPTMTKAVLTQMVNKNDIENSSTTDKTNVNPRCKSLKALSVNKDLSRIINTPPANIHIPSNDRTVNNTLEIKVQNESIQNNYTTDIQDTLNNSCYDKKITGVDGNNSTNICDASKGSSKINIKTDNKVKPKTINDPIKDNNIHNSENNLVCNETYNESYKSELRTDNQEKATTASNKVTYYMLQSEEKFTVDNNKSNSENCKSEINTESVTIHNSKIEEEKNCSQTSDESNKSEISLDKGNTNTMNDLVTVEKKTEPDEKCSPNISEVNTDTEVESLSKGASKFLMGLVSSKKKISPKKSIIFKKSTESVTNGAVGEQEMDIEIEKKGRKNKSDGNFRKDKLLEDMSTPLESEIGLRLMQQMGWQGGALGRRGVGITEPIIPMLYLKRRAGLGHVKDESAEEAVFDFRVDILENILEFLDSENTDIKIDYVDVLSVKDRSFLKMISATFNDRKLASLRRGLESDIGRNIVDQLTKEDNLSISIKLLSNKKLILKKIYEKNSNEMKLNCKTIQNIKGSTTNTLEDDNDFILLFMREILEALVNEKKNKKIYFEGDLVFEYRGHIENIISNLNRRQIYESSPLKDLSEDIIERLGNHCLKAEYSADNMTFILKKVIDQNYLKNDAQKTLNNNANSEENDDNVTKDNLDVNDEIDKGNSKESLNHKSHKNYDSYNNCDVINENSLNIESSDDIHNSQKLDLIDRNKTDLSVLFQQNNCELIDNNSDKMETDNIDIKESKTVECDDAINNEIILVMVRKKPGLNNKKESTEYNIDRTVGLNTVENIDNSDHVIAKETKPPKEISSNEFDIKCDRKNCDSSSVGKFTNEMNASDVYSSSEKSAINTEKRKVFFNTGNQPRRIVIIENVNKLCSTIFLKVIQSVIANKISETSETFIPQLKCHGVEIRGIIYSCHNEETFQWLLKVLFNYKIRNYKLATDKDKFNVQIQIKTMLEFEKVLTLLELCNVGLCCENWVVLDAKNSDFSVFLVNIDNDSLNYICDNNFRLSIGIDEAQFSIYCNSRQRNK